MNLTLRSLLLFLIDRARPSLLPSGKFYWENLWHGKVNLNFWIVRRKWSCCCKLLETKKITSMIAQRMIVDICASPRWKYPLCGLEFEKLIWPVLFANIDLNWPYTFWDRTYSDSKGQCVSLWSNIWCWTTSLWTHCKCRAETRVQVTRNISKFIWRQNSNRKVSQRIEKFETHEECDCIRQASEGFIKNSAYLIGWNVSSEGKWSINSLLVAPPKPSEAFRTFHNKNTDDRTLIWRTEPDNLGLPLDRHFTFYFAGLKANIYTKSTKKLLKVFLNKWTWINT